MEFNYVATTHKGEVKKGVIQALSQDKVREHLRSQNLLIISITSKGKGGANATGLLAKRLGFGKSSLMERITFARHLAVMLKAGLSLVEALESIRSQPNSKKMQKIINSIIENVGNGQTLSSSLAQFPKTFSGIFISMVEVGEASGTLERNLDYVATELEKDYELLRKVKAAMIYPVIILSATAALGIGMSIFILPKLVDMFKTFRLELPITTRVFLNGASFLVDYGLYLIVLLAALIIAFRIIIKAKWAKPFFHALYLKIPVAKTLIRNINLVRLSRVMAILLKSGVTINEALNITATALNNVYYKRQAEKALKAVKKGQPLASALRHKEYIPTMMNKMIDVGEKTGNLEQSLFYLADFYEEEVNNTTKNISTLVEPILLVVIGILLGFLAVAIISPIYSFTGSLQR